MEVKIATVTFTDDDISDASTSQTANAFYTTPNIYILQLFARVKEAFVGVTAPTVALGIAGHTQKYMPTQGIGVTGDLCGTVDTGNTAPCKRALSYQKTPGNIRIVATFTSASGNLSALTEGEIEFVMVYVE